MMEFNKILLESWVGFDILGLLRLALWPPTMLPGLDMVIEYELWILRFGG